MLVDRCASMHGYCLQIGGVPMASLSGSVTNSSYHGSLQAAGALAAFRCLTLASTLAKAFLEWFSHGNGGMWREQRREQYPKESRQ